MSTSPNTMPAQKLGPRPFFSRIEITMDLRNSGDFGVPLTQSKANHHLPIQLLSLRIPHQAQSHSLGCVQTLNLMPVSLDKLAFPSKTNMKCCLRMHCKMSFVAGATRRLLGPFGRSESNTLVQTHIEYTNKNSIFMQIVCKSNTHYFKRTGFQYFQVLQNLN